MKRIETSRSIETIGKRVLIDIWKCFDRHCEIYGKPTEADNYMRKVNISSIAGKIFVRFEPNKVYAITCFETRNEDIAIVCFEDDETEIIMTEEEAQTVFRNMCKEESEVCQAM